MASNKETFLPGKTVEEKIDAPRVEYLRRDWEPWDLFLFQIDAQTSPSTP
jgi:hypothetical protein